MIIFGLTGRTGSGCTTLSKILSTESIEEMDLRSYKTCDFNNSDERKYSVVYRYMKEGKHWKKFHVIEASSIIFSFVIEKSYEKLFDFIDSISSIEGVKIKEVTKLKEDIEECLRGDKSNGDKKEDVIDNGLIDYLNICKLIRNGNNDYDKEKLRAIVKYFTVELKDIKKRFCKILQNYNVERTIQKNGDSEIKIYNLYTYFMQMIANNIRSSGDFDKAEEIAGKEITVADRINSIIAVINRCEELEHPEEECTRVCIDALRNSAEIQYFRDRYRAFYAVAVSTEDKDRKNRLELNKKEIKSLDEIEYPDDNQVFYHQNIQACLQIADIYIYNPDVTDHKYFSLSEQILKYIALILQPGLIAPTHIERCMQLAFNAKYNSGCLSRQVGAVITGTDFSVRAVGWNDVPKGQVPCNLRCIEDYCRNKDTETFSDFELNNILFDEAMYEANDKLCEEEVKRKKAGRYYSYCFKDVYNGLTKKSNQVYTRALHAEENAFLQIAKYGGAEIQGGKLFSTASPCELCSKKAYQLGIKEIYYIDPYPGISQSHILKFGKDNNPKMILFQGAIGNAYISLYSPRMPYKDEMELVTGINVKEIGEEIHNRHKDD